MYRLEEMNNDLNMVCLDENSKAYVYDGDEDSDEIKSFLKKFADSKPKFFFLKNKTLT